MLTPGPHKASSPGVEKRLPVHKGGVTSGPVAQAARGNRGEGLLYLPALDSEPSASFAYLYGRPPWQGIEGSLVLSPLCQVWGLEMFTGPSSSRRWVAINACSEKAKQLLPCKLYLISLKNVYGRRSGRDAMEGT